MTRSNLRGVLSMLAAVATFSMMDVALKRLVEIYPVMQVTFLRGAASLPLLIGAAGMFGRWSDLLPKRWTLHVVRGFLSIAVLWCFIYALRLLSLADAYTIFMSAPLLIVALSVPMLGEQVDWRRWMAVMVGLIGVLVVLKPTGSNLITLGGVAALASAFGYALGAILVRILSRTDSSAAITVIPLAVLTLVCGIASIATWVPLQSEHWPWIVGVGVFGALGQYFFTEAFRHAQAGVIAPLEYTALIWGVLFDWLLWLTVPSSRMLTGAAIIVASGLYVIYRERASSAPVAG
jgi:drug/metabolite transporter (DMT)-like permease